MGKKTFDLKIKIIFPQELLFGTTIARAVRVIGHSFNHSFSEYFLRHLPVPGSMLDSGDMMINVSFHGSSPHIV